MFVPSRPIPCILLGLGKPRDGGFAHFKSFTRSDLIESFAILKKHRFTNSPSSKSALSCTYFAPFSTLIGAHVNPLDIYIVINV